MQADLRDVVLIAAGCAKLESKRVCCLLRVELAAAGKRRPEVDPVQTAAILAALASGVGGALGSQLWGGVSALVRSPFRRATSRRDTAAASGATELAALAQAPGDDWRAMALAEVLIARAAADDAFRQELEAWWVSASHITASGDVTNTITGGAFNAPVVQGRDFLGIRFGFTVSEPSGSRDLETG